MIRSITCHYCEYFDVGFVEAQEAGAGGGSVLPHTAGARTLESVRFLPGREHTSARPAPWYMTSALAAFVHVLSVSV